MHCSQHCGDGGDRLVLSGHLTLQRVQVQYMRDYYRASGSHSPKNTWQACPDLQVYQDRTGWWPRPTGAFLFGVSPSGAAGTKQSEIELRTIRGRFEACSVIQPVQLTPKAPHSLAHIWWWVALIVTILVDDGPQTRGGWGPWQHHRQLAGCPSTSEPGQPKLLPACSGK